MPVLHFFSFLQLLFKFEAWKVHIDCVMVSYLQLCARRGNSGNGLDYVPITGSLIKVIPSGAIMSAKFVFEKTTSEQGPQAQPSNTHPVPVTREFTKENPVLSSSDCLRWASCNAARTRLCYAVNCAILPKTREGQLQHDYISKLICNFNMDTNLI